MTSNSPTGVPRLGCPRNRSGEPTRSAAVSRWGAVWVWAGISAVALAQPRNRPAENVPAVPGFGLSQGQRPIPGFGPEASSALVLAPEDLARAAERLQQYDTNRDGYLDRNEARAGQWRDDPFQHDVDRDNRLNRNELARRYALRRVAEAGGGRGPYPAPPPNPNSANLSREEQERRQREQQAAEEARRRAQWRGTRESWHLTETLMGRHDANRDGFLDSTERSALGISAAADTDRDFRISRPELAEWLAVQEREAGRATPRALPAWFAERDTNGDGQVQMSEFAAEWTDEALDEFVRLDLNNDGMIVAEECLQAMGRLNAEHTNQRFTVIPSKGTVRSVIEVTDKDAIADLDVQLQITHTHDDHLNVFLVGPDAHRVELFTNVGGQDDHFDGTILDEESPSPIVRGRPPFEGRFQTEEFARGGKGLKQFYGTSMAGTWTLVIDANSDRPGVLHGWSLIFRRLEEGRPPPDKEFD